MIYLLETFKVIKINYKWLEKHSQTIRKDSKLGWLWEQRKWWYFSRRQNCRNRDENSKRKFLSWTSFTVCGFVFLDTSIPNIPGSKPSLIKEERDLVWLSNLKGQEALHHDLLWSQNRHYTNPFQSTTTSLLLLKRLL